MKIIDRCPSCGGAPSRSWPALTAPFIAEYALQSPVSLCILMECGICGLRFFNHRYEEDEMKRLYSGYRGETYFQVRHRHEFWYLRRHNDGTGHDSNVLMARKAATETFLRNHIEVNLLSHVLDYGGDSGQFIPDAIGSQKEVFEVSDATPIPGVQRISDESQLEEGRYDLVLLNHVLEHASDPADLLRRVTRLMKPGIGILHVEVPLEHYDLSSVGHGAGEVHRLTKLIAHPIWLQWLDFYSTLFRVALKFIPPFGFLKLHEHINIFDDQALAKACELAGLHVIAIETGDKGSGPVVTVLAQRHSHQQASSVSLG